MQFTRAIFLFLIFSSVLSVGAMYYRFFVLQDFEIYYDDYGEGDAVELESEALTEDSSIEPE